MTETNVPRLRFKQFGGEWKEDILLSLLDDNDGIRRGPFGSSIKKSDFDKNNDYGVYEQQNAIHDVNAIRYFINENKYEELKKFTIQSQDIIMSGAGTIGKISVIPNNHIPGVFNQALIRIRKNESTDLNYLVQFIKSDNVQRMLKSNNPGSAIQNLKPMKYIKNMDVYFPNFVEQQKIGSFFSKIDKIIELQTKKLDQLNKLKRGYLQKMFPQDGESLPRLRFSGFSGEWRELKLKETLKVGKSGGTPSTKNKEYYEGTIPFLSIRDVTESNGIINDTEKHINNDAIQNSSSWIVPKGSLTISMYASVGSVAKFSSDIATSQAFFNMIFNDGIDVDFMYHFFNQYNLMGRWKRLIATGTQGNLNATEINNIIVRIPSEIEQRKIASFLSKLDQIINNQSDKINFLQQEKKSYLQKMFI